MRLHRKVRRIAPAHLAPAAVFALAHLAPAAAFAQPVLTDPGAGVLELVTPPSEAAKLNLIDGLAFDAYGNLLGCLEITGTGGAVVFIDKATGLVTTLVTGISRADQIALHPSGDFFVTSEVSGASTTARLYRVTVGYGPGNVPQAATTTAASLTTSLAINNPEGCAVLETTGAYGNAGDVLVAEDVNPGRILRVDPATGTTTVLASGLRRPEGLAIGDFGGALPLGVVTAETLDNNVLGVAAGGTVSVLGTPAAVSLAAPDNVEFGPDGFLYVTEDRTAPNGRILRIASDGTHSVFAGGFGQAQGMIFDPANGDFYVAEQDSDRVWRVRFGATAVPDADATAEARTGAMTVSVAPNPFRSSTVISFEVGRPGPVRVAVFDVAGRRVRVLADGARPAAGEVRIPWDGRNDAGEAVAPGMYLVRLSESGRERGGAALRLK
jgi:sugar lactone lactonase YvrE